MEEDIEVKILKEIVDVSTETKNTVIKGFHDVNTEIGSVKGNVTGNTNNIKRNSAEISSNGRNIASIQKDIDGINRNIKMMNEFKSDITTSFIKKPNINANNNTNILFYGYSTTEDFTKEHDATIILIADNENMINSNKIVRTGDGKNNYKPMNLDPSKRHWLKVAFVADGHVGEYAKISFKPSNISIEEFKSTDFSIEDFPNKVDTDFILRINRVPRVTGANVALDNVIIRIIELSTNVEVFHKVVNSNNVSNIEVSGLKGNTNYKLLLQATSSLDQISTDVSSFPFKTDDITNSNIFDILGDKSTVFYLPLDGNIRDLGGKFNAKSMPYAPSYAFDGNRPVLSLNGLYALRIPFTNTKYTDMTISFWMNRIGTGNNYIFNHSTNADKNGIRFYDADSVYVTNRWAINNDKLLQTRNKWFHVVITSNGKMYINGTLKYSGKFIYDPSANPRDFIIGAYLHPSNNNLYSYGNRCYLKNFRVLKKIVSNDEVIKLYKEKN
jgi:hypothetical protein